MYGVSGMGRGHASRSKVLIDRLLTAGHEVRILTSGTGTTYLKEFYPDKVTDILGLTFSIDEEGIGIWRTLRKNFKEGDRLYPTMKEIQRAFKEFRPDLTITDFEPFTPFVSRLHRVPFISVDNIHILTAGKLSTPKAWRKDRLIANAVVRGVYTLPRRYVISSFFFPELKKGQTRTALVGPLLREEALRQQPKNNGHLLLYAPSETSGRVILDLVRQAKKKAIAYGFPERGEQDGITFREPCTETFLEDLASCSAVITGGGHSLISEALYLGKPVYSVPIKGQFEQMLNGHELQKLGYGLYDLDPTKRRLIRFLKGIERFRTRIKDDQKKCPERFRGNEDAFRIIDEEIAEATGKA